MPIYKKAQNGTWFCKFCYTDLDGTRRQKKKEGFRTKKEAQEYERDFLCHRRPDCEMPFSQITELYLEDCRSRLKPTTLTTRETMIRGKILPCFGAQPLNSITPAAIRRWQNALLAQGYSPTYLRAIHTQASAIFHFAVKYYHLSDNPCKTAGPIGKYHADEMNIWTPSEFSRFADALRDKPASWAAFHLLFWTGIRSGELLALTRDDFDFENHLLHITKNYARQNQQDLILSPKTPKSRRIVTLPAFLTVLIREYAQTRPEGRLFPQTKHFLYHEMQRGCAISGVPKIRVHDLRHSHASFLIENGFSPLLIAERLGHENIQTTLQIYSHLYPNKQTEVACRIQQFYEEQSK